MLTIAYYFLQVILCSCLLMGYYLLVLRNKRFHQYNRFYLLAVAIVSWIVPLIKIRWSHPVINQDPQVFQLLSVVADNNSQIENNISTRQEFQWSGYTIAAVVYIIIAIVLFAAMLLALYRVYRLLKQHSCKNVDDVYLILTKANGTPFSFFRYIFWNEEIDLRSESGKQILQHEITHVRQKHSIDKMFIQAMLIPGWFNPFFWLLKREMEMIHEFIADKKAVNNGDTASLAQMLLTAAYPQQRFAMTNPFFFSPIRRRLKMLTNNSNPRFSYMRRTIALPLFAIVVILFSFRNKESRNNTTLSVASVMESAISAVTFKGSASSKDVVVADMAMLEKTYTVLIDAGHGGEDKGVTAADGTSESDLTLSIARKIKELNGNEHINIILRRNNDVRQSPAEVVALINETKPDLYISVHINATPPVKGRIANTEDPNGILFFIPTDKHADNYAGSQLLASMIAGSMKQDGQTILGIRGREKSLIVDRIKVPGVLLLAGNFSNPDVVSKLKDAVYQQKLANEILNGMNSYFSGNEHKAKPVAATIINAMEVTDTILPRSFATSKDQTLYESLMSTAYLNEVLIIIDNQKKTVEDLQKMLARDIETIAILKKGTAMAKYGPSGSNGAIVMTTLKKAVAGIRIEGHEIKGDSIVERVTTKGVIVAGTTYRWNRPGDLLADSVVEIQQRMGVQDLSKVLYVVDGVKIDKEIPLESLKPDMINSINVLKGMDAVGKYGSDARNGVIEILTRPGKNGQLYFRTSPPLPGRYYVRGYPSDSIKNIRRNDVPGFPGGQSAWYKYLDLNMDKNLVEKKGAAPGKYTVIISFNVAENGEISNVRAENDPGFGARQEAERLIKKSPNWVPAIRDGKAVAADYKQPVIFYVADRKANNMILKEVTNSAVQTPLAKLDPDKVGPK